jgi:hypothetical protein
MRVEDEEDLEDLEVLFVEYRALDIIEGTVMQRRISRTK